MKDGLCTRCRTSYKRLYTTQPCPTCDVCVDDATPSVALPAAMARCSQCGGRKRDPSQTYCSPICEHMATRGWRMIVSGGRDAL